MFNIFQQPWALLAVSFVLLVVVYIMRTSYPEKQKWWHLLIPVLVIVLAFGLDHLVKTDREKVKDALENIITATMDKDIEAIDRLIAEDYKDRHHPSKPFIMTTCRIVVKRHNIKSITMTYHNIVIEGKEANTEIIVRLRMDTSSTTMLTPEYNYAKVKLTLKKKPDETWVIKSTELVEVNKTPVNWKRAY
ncbi:MAG: hypothetical protein FVQ82_14410 [Planctomycetes bacterium]|nr:hypothetical protein [Planctomycetota bacterium]